MFVGRRDCTNLVAGVHKQTQLVARALEGHGILDVPMLGKLCFVDADWPLFGASFTIDDVEALRPKALRRRLLEPGTVSEPKSQDIHHHLAMAFPTA